jgi:hypothetical protein
VRINRNTRERKELTAARESRGPTKRNGANANAPLVSVPNVGRTRPPYSLCPEHRAYQKQHNQHRREQHQQEALPPPAPVTSPAREDAMPERPEKPKQGKKRRGFRDVHAEKRMAAERAERLPPRWGMRVKDEFSAAELEALQVKVEGWVSGGVYASA